MEIENVIYIIGHTSGGMHFKSVGKRFTIA